MIAIDENYVYSDVNKQPTFFNNMEALNMQNSGFDTYHKPYTKNDEIKEFSLSIGGVLNEKMKEIIQYYKAHEHLNDIEIVETVIRFGLIRSYKMSYLVVKSYLFKISELDRDVDMYSDAIVIVDDKKHLMNASDIKYQNFWIKTEYPDELKEQQFQVSEPVLEDIDSISLKISGLLLSNVEDCMSVFQEEYNYSQKTTLELMIRVGINQVYELLCECCNIDELNHNDIFAYDH
jgi:hypothetical protein